MIDHLLTVTPPTEGAFLAGAGCFLGGLAVLLYLLANWTKPDRWYDQRPPGLFVAETDRHAMRRTGLPNALALVVMGFTLMLARWRPDAPSGIYLALVLAFVVHVCLSLTVFRYNRPRFLVRPALRDKPGSRDESRLLRQERKELGSHGDHRKLQ